MPWLKPSTCTCERQMTHAQIKMWVMLTIKGVKTKASVMNALSNEFWLCSRCTVDYITKEYK